MEGDVCTYIGRTDNGKQRGEADRGLRKQI